MSAGDVLDHEKLQLVELPVGFEPTVRDHPHCVVHQDEGQVGVGSVEHVVVLGGGGGRTGVEWTGPGDPVSGNSTDSDRNKLEN